MIAFPKTKSASRPDDGRALTRGRRRARRCCAITSARASTIARMIPYCTSAAAAVDHW